MRFISNEAGSVVTTVASIMTAMGSVAKSGSGLSFRPMTLASVMTVMVVMVNRLWLLASTSTLRRSVELGFMPTSFRL